MGKIPTLADYLKALPWGVAFGADSDDEEEEEGDEDDAEHVRLKRRVNRLLKERGDGAGQQDKIAELSKEAKKRRLQNKELKQELEALKSGAGTKAGEELKRLQLQLRFERAGRRMGMDDAAATDLFKLAYDELATAVDEDTGKVDKQKLGTLVESSLDKYPWAKADSSSNGKGDHDDDGDGGAPDTTTGSTSRGKHSRPNSNADLTTRFPALAGRNPRR